MLFPLDSRRTNLLPREQIEVSRHFAPLFFPPFHSAPSPGGDGQALNVECGFGVCVRWVVCRECKLCWWVGLGGDTSRVASGGISEMEGECLGDAEAKLLHGVDLRSWCGV
jgi:hypothetical protein